MQNLEPGQIWFVRSISSDSPEVDLVEIEYLNGNVVGFGEAYYDLRLLDFVGRDYESEEQREQERFLEQMRAHDDVAFKEQMLGSFEERTTTAIHDAETELAVTPNDHISYVNLEDVQGNPIKLSWWTRLKLWWIGYDYRF